MEKVINGAKQAFIYGYPTVDLYHILFKYAVDTSSPEYKAPMNTIYNTRRVATPEDKAIVAMNCDTPYSYVWLDLRAEPIVLSSPHFEPNRYVSLMLSDLYSYIIGYVTPRTNGCAGGDFVIAGPDWTGSVPSQIKYVFRSPTHFALAFYRTQLFNPDDLTAVWAIQDQFTVEPLSHYAGTSTPPHAPEPVWCEPVDVRKEPTSLQFFSVLTWMLQYMPVLDEEKNLRNSFEAIGIRPASGFVEPDAAVSAALVAGMQAGLQEMTTFLGQVRSSADLFGSRSYLGDRYINRAVGAMVGILGNSAEEYLGIGYPADADGRPFNGSYAYQIKFRPEDLPPVKAFWSITVYDAAMQLYANPLRRYVINSAMLDQLIRDADGGFTLYLQHDAPGQNREANWLPTPKERFNLTFRAYEPERAILDFSYHAPPVVKAA